MLPPCVICINVLYLQCHGILLVSRSKCIPEVSACHHDAKPIKLHKHYV